jgi:hypothetical protein
MRPPAPMIPMPIKFTLRASASALSPKAAGEATGTGAEQSGSSGRWGRNDLAEARCVMVERDRETVVVTDGGDRGSSGAIIAVILLLALLVVGYLLYSNGVFGGGGGSDTKVDIKIENPLKEGGK